MNCFHTLTHEALYKGLPTIASPGTPLRVDILERLGLLFRYMVDRYPQSLFLGCEVSFPRNVICPPGNCLFLHFLQRFAGALRGTGLDLVYAWSRDQGREDTRQRYSFVVLVQQNPLQPTVGCISLAESLWHGHTLGVAGDAELVMPYAGDGIRIYRDQPGWEMALAQCHELASRLARFDTKSMATEANSFGSSRI
jgi:hypothetical protein